MICDTCPLQGPATPRAMLGGATCPLCCHPERPGGPGAGTAGATCACPLCPISVMSPPMCPVCMCCHPRCPVSPMGHHLCPLGAIILVPGVLRVLPSLVPCPCCPPCPPVPVYPLYCYPGVPLVLPSLRHMSTVRRHPAYPSVSPTLSPVLCAALRVSLVLPSLLPRVLPYPSNFPAPPPSLPVSPPLSPCPRPAMAPLADLYQVSMAYGHWRAGRHRAPAAAELFFRRPPFRGSFALGAGLAEGLRGLRAFRFSAAGAWRQRGDRRGTPGGLVGRIGGRGDRPAGTLRDRGTTPRGRAGQRRG